MMHPRVLLGCLLAFASPLVAAQATRPAELGELFYQLQLLQHEVMQLRGQIEAQDKQLRDLKQQRLDDYINLDRRLSELSATPAARPPLPAAGSAAPAAGVPAAVPPVAARAAPASESDAYQQAFALVRARQFAEATTAFTAFLANWPNGSMAPNAHYWLGELALQDNRLDEASGQFRVVIERFPKHDKVPDAQFKLARIQHLQGDAGKARELMRQVISQYPGSNAAQLAQNYLNSQF